MHLPSITFRYIFALMLLALLSFTAFSVNTALIRSQSCFSSIINMSGRQRMLSQRIVKSYLLGGSHSEQLLSAIRDMEEAHLILSDFKHPLNRYLKDEESVKSLFFEFPYHQDSQVKKFISIAKNLDKSTANSQKLVILSEDLLRGFEALTKNYEILAKRKVKFLFNVEVIVLTVTLLTLLLEALFIFRPLDHKIQSNSQAIKDLVSMLEANNSDLEAFIYAASHDLKEPVRTIMNHVGYLESECLDELNNSSHNSMYRIRNRTEYLYNLTDNLLDYHKTKNHKLELETVDLNKLVNKYPDQKNINKNSFQITSDDLPLLKTDRYLISLIFYHILDNAYEFQNPAKDSKLKIKYYEDENKHCFEFIDNGIGIDKENIEKIFKPFFSSKNKSKSNASGLGLTIVRNAIFSLNADLSIKSSDSEGTVILLKL